MGKLTTYFSHAKEEIQKVIFPTKTQVRQAFFAVFLVVTVISIFLSLVGWMMTSIITAVVG